MRLGFTETNEAEDNEVFEGKNEIERIIQEGFQLENLKPNYKRLKSLSISSNLYQQGIFTQFINPWWDICAKFQEDNSSNFLKFCSIFMFFICLNFAEFSRAF